jgi:FAD/FMN-containing dehydrogenase
VPSNSLQAPSGYRGAFRTDLDARSAYSEAAGPYRIVPAAVAVPIGPDDLALLIRLATDTGVPLVPRAAGSAMPGSNVGSGIVVDLQHFDRPLFVSAYKSANVGAAISLAEVNRAASHFNLRLPPDPSSQAFCTIGGMVSTNAAGARSYKYGSIRRWVRGIELITADGEFGWIGRERDHRRPRRPRGRQASSITHDLTIRRRIELETWPDIDRQRDLIAQHYPRTRKNTAGYALDAFLESGDLVDLFIGAEGTLGFITRVELDLDVVPPARSLVLLALADLDTLPDVIARVSSLEPSACEFLDRTFLDLAQPAGIPLDGIGGVLMIEFERRTDEAARGVAGDVVRDTRPWCRYVQTAITEDEQEQLWRIRHAASPVIARLSDGRRSVQIVEDGCVPVDCLAEYIRGVHEAAAASEIDIVAFGHAGDGHLHVNVLVNTRAPDIEGRLKTLLDRVSDLVLNLGGTPSGEHGDGRLRGPLLERMYGPEITALFRQLKHACDPANILNPGVIVPADGQEPIRDLKVGRGAAEIPEVISKRLRTIEREGAWDVSKMRVADEPAPSTDASGAVTP